MNTYAVRTEIKQQSAAVRRAAVILAAATPRQKAAASRYAARVVSRFKGLLDGRQDYLDAASESVLPIRARQAALGLPGFDAAAYADGWATAYYD